MMDTFFAVVSSSNCAQVAVPEASELAMRFYRSGNYLWTIQQFWSLIVPLLFLMGGFSARLAGFSRELGKKWFFTIVIYLILFTIFYTILNIPLDFYSDYIRPHDYDLSSQTEKRWFGNYGKSVLISLIGALAFVWIFYLLLKKSPRRWWLYSSFVSVAILFMISFVQPIWIDPLFNNFGPMKNKQLEEKILHLAARAGIEHGKVFEVDKSQDTNMLNAYVVGMGATNRIVLWDTTIHQMKTDQIMFVMGHEMGHYILHHIWWAFLYFALLSFVIFYLIYKIGNFIVHRYAHYLGFQTLCNIASLPLLLFLITFFMLLTIPLSNYVSRCMEHEADRFGLEITHNNKAAAEAFIVLQQKNLANPNPGPIYTFWRCSHPSLGDRIRFCNSYCPWKHRQPLKYSRYFTSQAEALDEELMNEGTESF